VALDPSCDMRAGRQVRPSALPSTPTLVDGGCIFFVMYGSKSDWVQNVLAAKAAILEIDGDEVELSSPKLISTEEARQLLPPTTKTPPDYR